MGWRCFSGPVLRNDADGVKAGAAGRFGLSANAFTAHSIHMDRQTTMIRRGFPLLLALASVSSCAPRADSAGPAMADPMPPAGVQATSAAFAPERLARIDSVYEERVRNAEMAGAVVLVTRHGVPVYRRAFGWADREAGRPMTDSSIFRIASQTKAITSVAVLMLLEEGMLGLDDPVSRFLPTFSGATVVTDSAGERRRVPVRRAITIRDLLTHTAGISYGTGALVSEDYIAAGLGPAAGFGWYTADRDEPICQTMDRLGTLPFVAHPGERYVYGYATDVLGCVVERASGVSLDRFFTERITGPLGMRDTRFFLAPEGAARLTAVYTRGSAPGGELRRAPDGARGQGHYVEGPRRSFSGGAGLVSTAADYERFLRMILQGGEMDGVRILSPAAVRLLTTNQVGSLYPSEGEGYSLAFRTTDEPGQAGRPAPVGSFGWGGAYGSEYMVDPVEGLILIFLVQEVPNTSRHADPLAPLVYDALVESVR